MRDIIKLYFLNEGYSGLVQAKRLNEPFTEVVATFSLEFRANPKSSGGLMVYGTGGQPEPYTSQIAIPFYATNYRIGMSGLPVVRKE
jgi:hypothetical protein